MPVDPRLSLSGESGRRMAPNEGFGKVSPLKRFPMDFDRKAARMTPDLYAAPHRGGCR